MINALELVLSLPNNLVGRVPITAISSALTQRLHESAADAADADGNLDQEPENDVDLESLFEVGQYLRAYVVSTTDYKALAAGKMRHHIELSLQPEQANTGLSEQGIVENVTIMASVASVEDHGFVMDVGIAGSDMRGFLSRKQVDSSIAPQRLQPGSVLLCSIISKKSKIVQLSTLRERLGSVKYFPSEATTIDSFLPGTTADVLISDVTPRGVVGKVMGHLDVTADLVHSGAGPDGVDLESSYKIGSRLRARVICNFLEAAKPKLGISVLPHVVALKSKVAVQDGTEVGPLTLLPSSSLVETCTVRKVEAYIGLYVDVGVQNVPGFVHISRVKDGKVDALFENSGPYKVGSTHPGRVIGYSFFDGLFLLSLEKRVLEQPFIRIQDVPVGEVVSGLVERLVINKDGLGGVTVQLADGISGLVPEMHLADVPLRHPERKFRPGMKVKARVLSTNPSKHQIRLTLKKSLVNSEEPALKTFEEAAVGMQAHGAIIKILQHGAIVQFYGELRGFLPVSKMSEAYISDPKEHFRIGQVVSVHVLSVDPDARRLIVSCKDPRAPSLEQQLAMKSPQLGDLVSATVTQKTDDDTHDVEMANTATGLSVGLDAGGFDWSGGAVLDADDDTEMRDLALSQQTRKGKQRREGQIQVDKTAELDVHGPQTSSDYERLLLGQPDSSQLWIEYMAFQMKVSDLSKAREVAERAIRTINIREETEKLNVWVAYLNLEVAYGTEDSVSEVFQRACTHNDSQEVYERLASIYIIAKKYKVYHLDEV